MKRDFTVVVLRMMKSVIAKAMSTNCSKNGTSEYLKVLGISKMIIVALCPNICFQELLLEARIKNRKRVVALYGSSSQSSE